MPNVVDLTLVSQARRALFTVLDERGLGFFLQESSRVPRLDPRRIAWIVEAARRKVGERARRDPNALSRTRRVVRRELIRRLAEAMLQAGLQPGARAGPPVARPAARRQAPAMDPIPEGLPRQLLDGSPDAVLIAGRDGSVRYWNAAAQRIFGHTAEEAAAGGMDLIIPERLRGRHWEGWDSVMKTGVTRYGEGQLLAVPALRKDGRQISIEFSIQLLRDAAGGIEWVVAVIRDVTERFEREKALRARVKALEAKGSAG